MRNFSTLLLIFVFLCSGCGGSGENGGNSDNKKGGNGSYDIKNRVNWGSVPSEFNPRVSDIELELEDVDVIQVDLFNFDDDVEVVYTNNLDRNTAILRTYTVFRKSASWGQLNKKYIGNTLDLNLYGTYKCSIDIKNGNITALEGGCYVRVQILMPPAAEIEVYNVRRLLTKKFFAISTENFLGQFDDATWADEKFETIEEYIQSYKELQTSPELVAEELEVVLKGFSSKDDKFKALRRLHRFVSDRENLRQMIENVFISSWDKDEAKQIVGI